jgi:DNA-binding NtrC family response regulator
MASTALLVTDDSTTRDKIATIFEFIDYSLVLSDNVDATDEALQSVSDFVIALVALGDSARQSETLTQIHKLHPSLPVYVVREDVEGAPTLLSCRCRPRRTSCARCARSSPT